MCNCITRFRAEWHPKGVDLATHTPLLNGEPTDETRVILKLRLSPPQTRPPTRIVATFCPFCGAAYS